MLSNDCQKQPVQNFSNNDKKKLEPITESHTETDWKTENCTQSYLKNSTYTEC